VYNTGTSASNSLQARIHFVPDLALAPEEHSVTIKVPTPAVVASQDSAVVTWLLHHPPTFSQKNYRIYLWLKTSAVDSFETQKLLMLPAMTAPDFRLVPRHDMHLVVKPDSSGYANNPFPVYARLANHGGSALDDVSLQLYLPPDYILEPDIQANPYHVPFPLPRAAPGAPRLDIEWTVRYLGASIFPRSDTMRLVARGRDITGKWREKHAQVLVEVDGLSPEFEITVLAPQAIDFDASSIYSPQPVRVTARCTNIGEQYADLPTASLSLSGEGVSTTDPLQRPIVSSLRPGGTVELHWDVVTERRATPRSMGATVEITDADGRRRSTRADVHIPGQEYRLVLETISLPDTIALNAEGTDFLYQDILLRYSIENRTWYTNTLNAVRVQAHGPGIAAPVVREYQPELPLSPGETSAVLTDTFRVHGQVQGRNLTFQLLAISDRGDTAHVLRPVYVPGLRPQLRLDRRGVDELVHDRVLGYLPNPFYQEYILRNIGYVSVRVDSLRMSVDDDGLVIAEPLLRPIGWMLNPGDSLIVRWNMQAQKRTYPRTVAMSVSAWTSGEQEVEHVHSVSIPGLSPIPELSVGGDDTLSWDPVTVYTPNPFRKTLEVRNIGTDMLQCDSARLQFRDDMVVLLDPASWISGESLAPDSGMVISWRLQAEEREMSVLLPVTVTLYHDGEEESTVSGSVYIPGLTPGLHAVVLGDMQLSMDSESVYIPNPFVKTVRITNSGTGTLMLDSIRLRTVDTDLYFDENHIRHINSTLASSQMLDVHWHGRSAPRFSASYVLIEFDVYHGGGEVLSLASDIFIPGRAHSFDVVDIDHPAAMQVNSAGDAYTEQGFSIRYRARNNSWAYCTFSHAAAKVAGVSGVELVTTPREHHPNEVLASQAVSQVLIDTFVVSHSLTERLCQIDITVYDNFMRSGVSSAKIFLPSVSTTDVFGIPVAKKFGIAGVYPNPFRRGSAAEVFIALEGGVDAVVEVELFDLFGRRVAWTTVLTAQRIVPVMVEDIAAGVYLVRARQGKWQSSSMLQVY